MGDQEPEDDGGAISGFFDDEESAVEEFFSPRTARPRLPARRVKKPKPTHYRVVSISLYTDDQKRLAALVAELKNRGYSRANRSLVIREALRQVDLDLVPPQR